MQQELRIGFVSIQDATDVSQWSGIPFNVLSGLRRQDIHVELYSPLSRRRKIWLTGPKALAGIRKTGLSLDHYPMMLNSYASQISHAIRERPVDVILSMSSIPIAALKCPQPIIFWTDAVFHAMYNYYSGGFSSMSPAAILRGKSQEEAGLNNCTFAAYSSEWAAATARKLTHPGKITVVPFGASLAIHHTRLDVEQWAEKRRKERPGRCELLFIGVDWERKGGATAVETARILNQLGLPTRLTVVGCQPPGPLPDFVRSLGFISKATANGLEQLKGLLREADFFILPTLAEAAGIVFCEASAFGLPSISNATGGVPEYVRTGVNGVCLPVGTPAAGFAQAIRDLVHDADRYHAICLGAFDEYKNRLNWDTSLAALVNLCRRAANQAAELT